MSKVTHSFDMRTVVTTKKGTPERVPNSFSATRFYWLCTGIEDMAANLGQTAHELGPLRAHIVSVVVQH